MASPMELFKSKCDICGKTMIPAEDSYVMIGVFKDNHVDYDPVRKSYLKHYLEKDYNMCIPCYQKVKNFIEGMANKEEK